MVKPGVLCKLRKGALIDTQENFVDTFNWMVDFINELRGLLPIKVFENEISLSDDPDDWTNMGDVTNILGGGGTDTQVITDVGYDPDTQRFYKKYKTIKANSDDDTESEDTVFQAVPYEAPA